MNKRRNVLLAVFALAGAFLLAPGCQSGGCVYCVNSDDYDLGGTDMCVGSTCGSCGGSDGIVCNTDCLQCTWYPTLTGCGNWSALDCMGGEELDSINFGCTVCGWDFCAGATAEYGGEYAAAEKNVTIEKAAEGEDYTINGIEVMTDGGILMNFADNLNKVDFSELFVSFEELADQLKNDYFTLDYQFKIRTTIRYTAHTDLAGVSLSQTVTEYEWQQFVSQSGVSKTVSAHTGNSVSDLEKGKIKEENMILKGEHVIVLDLVYPYGDILNNYYMEFDEYIFNAYKVVEEK